MMVYTQTPGVLDRLAKRRLDILSSAIEVADIYGLDEFKITKVPQYTGLAIGTVYLHFINRDELVAHVIAHCANEDTKTMIDACSQEREPMRRLARALQAFVTIYTSTRKLHPSLMEREHYRRTVIRTFGDLVAECGSSSSDMLATAIVGALHTVLLSQTNLSRAHLAELMEAVLRIADVNPQTYRARVTSKTPQPA